MTAVNILFEVNTWPYTIMNMNYEVLIVTSINIFKN